MGVIRLPLLRAMSLLLVLGASAATWAGDLTFGPPPIAGQRASKPPRSATLAKLRQPHSMCRLRSRPSHK